MSIKEFDSNNDLSLLHYINCNDNSENMVKNTRGIIYDKNKNIICKTFGYTPEILSSDKESLEKLLPKDFVDHSTFYSAEEGFILRLFFHKNKWYLSTHKKLNAFDSYWSSNESCGTQFVKSLIYLNKKTQKIEYEQDLDFFDRFCDSLDKNYIYSFLVRNNEENRIVCETNMEPILYLVGVFNKDFELMNEDKTPDCVKWISFPEKHKFKDLQEIIEYVNDIDKFDKQGIIIYYHKEKECFQLKIMNPEYVEYFKVRNNEPNIYVRYLQLRKDPELLDKFTQLYLSNLPNFDETEEMLYNIVENITKSYIKRFIRKEYVVVPQKQYFIMQELHEWHLKNPSKNKVSEDKTWEILESKDASFLYSMITELLRKDDEEEYSSDDEENYEEFEEYEENNKVTKNKDIEEEKEREVKENN